LTAIDLGSNTIRFLNYDCTANREINAFEKVVRTAEGMHQSGRIGDEAVARIVEAIREARETVGIEPVVRATATAAFRMASNADEVLRELAARTGIAFTVIDAEKEAELTAAAVYEAAQKTSPRPAVLILDIGGASTEIIYKNAHATRSRSFDTGIVTSANRFGEDESALVASLAPMLDAIREFVWERENEWGKADLFTATAGTPTTLASIKQGMEYATYDKAKINGTVLSLRDISSVQQTLLKLDETARDRLVGSKRGDLVMCGIVIFKEIFKAVGFFECMVFDDGLREGIAIDACKNIR
jgi:exopolyphosphatase/guanosine-5'-triphosphate,3'-diphosphate pyrophosphatase